MLPCHRCKADSDVRVEPCDAGAAYGYVAYCNSCSGGEYEVSHGITRAAAEQAWDEAVSGRAPEDEAPTYGDITANVIRLGRWAAMGHIPPFPSGEAPPKNHDADCKLCGEHEFAARKAVR